MSATEPRPAPQVALHSGLARARWIWKASTVLLRSLVWLTAGTLSLGLLALLDNAWALPPAARLVAGWAWLAAAGGTLAGWVLWPCLWRISDQSAAVYLERKLNQRDNLLINAVQLRLRAPPGGSPEMVAMLLQGAAERLDRLRLSPLWERRRLWRWGLAGTGMLLLLALYALLSPTGLGHAYRRFTSPLADIPPLSRIRIALAQEGPLEMTAGDPLEILALVEAQDGPVPEQAFLVLQFDQAAQRLPMRPAKQAPPQWTRQLQAHGARLFSHLLPNLRAPVTFRVHAGDGQSRACRVWLRERPGLRDLCWELSPPPYTGRPQTRERPVQGRLEVLEGTRGRLVLEPTLALAGCSLAQAKDSLPLIQLPGLPERWAGTLDRLKPGPCTVALRSREGAQADPAWQGEILLRPDALPSVFFENAALNLPAAPGGTVPLALRARDDLGLRQVRLLVGPHAESGTERPNAGQPEEVQRWDFAPSGPLETQQLYPLLLDPARFSPGETYALYGEASDHGPAGNRARRSPPLLIRILTPEQLRAGVPAQLLTLFERVQQLIELQTKARGAVLTVKAFWAELQGKRQLDSRLQGLAENQEAVRSLAFRTAAETRAFPAGAAPALKTLRELAEGPIAKVASRLRELRKGGKGPAPAAQDLAPLEQEQQLILNRLLALLGTLASPDGQEREEQKDLADRQDARRLREELAAAREKVQEFIRAEEKVIRSSEELAVKKPEDLTELDREKLGALAKEEADWAKYFKEKSTDLSKVPAQDFSTAALAKEFNEVFQEIQKASEALQNKNVEIAVANEEAGLELAKKLETNLERWLPDTRDTQKWNMEEPKGEFDVPLADLPEELEDIIGELVDEEEQMSDEVEDVSSSWMDSADKGAGWDATDGNISNMSAKGVTGNRLPNQQEIGGRSGEGRSGKSHGQFVEETADGKGGRQTPTRVTQDPYEEGQVKDQSKDAVSGATGGGKTSGAAGEGLRGTPPPETARQLERLKQAQASLRQEAEQITTQLQAYHLPSAQMQEALRRMKALESGLQQGRGFDLRQAHSAVLDRLREAQQAVGYQARINEERSRPLPKQVRQEILSGIREGAPPGYQALLEAYYQALVEKEK